MHAIPLIIRATLEINRIVLSRKHILKKRAQKSITIRIGIVKLLSGVRCRANNARIKLMPRLILTRLGIEQIHPNVFRVYGIVKVVYAM